MPDRITGATEAHPDRIASATWADPKIVNQNYRCRLWSDIFLGRSASETPIGYGDDRHVMLNAGSRAGKGASIIVPTLAGGWQGPVVCIDPKGENATLTAARRGRGSQHCDGMGQAVFALDPYGEAKIDSALRARFNPLDELDPKDVRETPVLAAKLAAAIVEVDENAKDRFFDRSARQMVKALILYVISAPQFEGRRNLVTVRRLLMRGDWEQVEILEKAGEENIPSGHRFLWTDMGKCEAFGGSVADAGQRFGNMLTREERTFENVLSSAIVNTDFIDDEPMRESLATSDFRLDELKTRREGMSLYLILPQDLMETHYRWLRMVITLTLSRMQKVKGMPLCGVPVLMLLDEFPALKRMTVIENAAAQIAGYKVKLFFVVQTLGQLKEIYKENWETLLGVCGLKIFFSVEDNFTREYVSKQIGETEITRETRNSSIADATNHSHQQGKTLTRGGGDSLTATDAESWGEGGGTSRGTGGGSSWGVSGGSSHAKSKGTNTSWGSSSGTSGTTSYGPGFFGWFTPMKTGFSETTSMGSSFQRGENESETDTWNSGWQNGGSSSWNEGHSSSWNKGGSHSLAAGSNRNWSEADADSYTSGGGRTLTGGQNEVHHRRPLVYPDEVGLWFARIDDRRVNAYPGLALVLIAGERPIIVRRINYYEDVQFIRCFDPHPDHRYIKPGVYGASVQSVTSAIDQQGGNHVWGKGAPSWTVAVGDLVREGQLIGHMGGGAIELHAPCRGKITKLWHEGPLGLFPFQLLETFTRSLLEVSYHQWIASTKRSDIWNDIFKVTAAGKAVAVAAKPQTPVVMAERPVTATKTYPAVSRAVKVAQEQGMAAVDLRSLNSSEWWQFYSLHSFFTTPRADMKIINKEHKRRKGFLAKLSEECRCIFGK